MCDEDADSGPLDEGLYEWKDGDDEVEGSDGRGGSMSRSSSDSKPSSSRAICAALRSDSI